MWIILLREEVGRRGVELRGLACMACVGKGVRCVECVGCVGGIELYVFVFVRACKGCRDVACRLLADLRKWAMGV